MYYVLPSRERFAKIMSFYKGNYQSPEGRIPEHVLHSFNYKKLLQRTTPSQFNEIE